MENYFSKFPSMVYNNYRCADITRKVKIVDQYLRMPNSFYQYELQNNERPDVLSQYAYEDPYYDWLIYLTNNVVDPYYQWYLSDTEFHSYIIDKYESIENAMKMTKFYRCNWYNDDVELTPSFFNNNLAEPLKKYFTPNFGNGTKIISYKRKQEDWVVNTNKYMVCGVSYTSGNNFVEKEIVDFKIGANIVGSAEVVTSNSSSITFQHVTGVSNTSVNILGETSGANAQLTSQIKVIENIPDSEIVFWEKVSVYDFEMENNEEKKTVNMFDTNYALPVSETLVKVMNEE